MQSTVEPGHEVMRQLSTSGTRAQWGGAPTVIVLKR